MSLTIPKMFWILLVISLIAWIPGITLLLVERRNKPEERRFANIIWGIVLCGAAIVAFCAGVVSIFVVTSKKSI